MGPTEQEFTGFMRRQVPRFRAVVVCSCALLAMPALPLASMSAAETAAASLIVAVAFVWGLLHLALVRRVVRPGALLAVDLAVLTGLCLGQALTVPATQTSHGSTWILVVVSFVAVGYQLTHPPLTGALVAVFLAGADLAGVVIDRPDGWAAALPNVGWLLVQSALSRVLYVVVRRRGRTADCAAAEAAGARQALRVAEARRAAERTHLATLHDTACATLLMASASGAAIRPDVVRTQAGRDLRRLMVEEEPTGQADLVAELSLELLRHPVRTELRHEGGGGTGDRAAGAGGGAGDRDGRVSLWRPAVVALRDSCGEALRNVARHAGVDEAWVTVGREGDVTVVTIDDRGRGFDPASVPGHKQGLARSVIGRMRAVGGRAEVHSGPGHGTRVRLEWPRA
ncbi:sensor histidine kinase [Streptomyces sp. NPDC047928]|uniref:sensor histidine kinase n=1 Tax=unclassified Streptomyces TaxID=2593676 RepID=UPI003711A650